MPRRSRQPFATCLTVALLTAPLWSLRGALAHNAICDCYDNGDGTVTCEGGFSDGSSAAGAVVRVIDANDRILIDGKMDGDSSFTFPMPDHEYYVVFDAGAEHRVEIYGEDIF